MWWRSLIALFLVLHGIVFAFLELDSWLLEGGRGLFIALGIAAAAGLAIGAVLLVARRRSWRLFVGAGAAVSLAQLLLFFEPSLVVGVGIDVAILAVIAWSYRATGGRPKVAGVSPA